jgi:hypothetical protein
MEEMTRTTRPQLQSVVAALPSHACAIPFAPRSSTNTPSRERSYFRIGGGLDGRLLMDGNLLLLQFRRQTPDERRVSRRATGS